MQSECRSARITIGAERALQASGQSADEFCRRHWNNDWGRLAAEDARRQDESLLGFGHPSFLMSVFDSSLGDELWVVTLAEEGTTILLPEEW